MEVITQSESYCSESKCTVNLSDVDAGKNLYEALRIHGYAILSNHNITINFLEDIRQEWSSFFLNKKKYSYLRTDESDEGYIPINYETASKELTADLKELYQTHYTGMFPSEINITSTRQLFSEMVKLNELICDLLEKHLPLNIIQKMEESLKEMISGSNNHLIRIIHYPPIDKNVKTERAAAHTDMCLFTMVFGALFNGLEFQNEHGKWFEPKMNLEEIVIFNSEMIEICTHKHLKAVVHRVKSNPNSNTESRFSIPIAFHPLRKSKLKNNLTAINYLKNRLNEMGYDGNLLNTKEY